MSASEEGRLRGTGWYISITGFWREYRKHRMGIIGVLALVLFVVMAVGAPIFATHDPSPSIKVGPRFMAPQWTEIFDPTGVVTRNYLQDPDLDSAAIGEIVVEGSSGEFTGARNYAASPDENSNVTFEWTHVANTSIEFRSPPDPNGNLPDTLDFIYYAQSFTWEYERLPKDVNITVSYDVVTTGDFLTNEYGGKMFELMVWVIDSSGDWTRIFESVPPYTGSHVDRPVDLGFLDIVAGWDGMIDEGDGQEDPTDTLTIAVGIAPTYLFTSSASGPEPWTYYNGSVTATITHMECVAFGDYFGILGTTDKGADAWSQLLFGSRISLYIGLVAASLSTAVGVAVGMISGYFGGKVDELVMRVVDFLLVIPRLPLLMVLAAFLGPSVDTIIIVIVILGWTGTSRLIRSQVLAEKNKSYVEAARAIGATDTYIIFRHILPNVTPLLFADVTLGVVAAILSESALSFLGLTDPSEPSWGRMLADAQIGGAFGNGAWWVVIFPGLMITMISLAFTFIGHTLDQVLNPRLRER
ncbi:MAG: ABC transporter permease subunit [Candidatus Thorarchaeota archaeon]